ncbi:hypothetical protein Hanom_Chr05g00472971 [Helianthus anomalus]
MTHGLRIKLRERISGVAERRVHRPIHFVQARRQRFPLFRHKYYWNLERYMRRWLLLSLYLRLARKPKMKVFPANRIPATGGCQRRGGSVTVYSVIYL